MRIAAVLAALLALATSGAAVAQTPRHDKPVPPREHKTSVEALAQAGDPQAQYRLGMAQLTGKGARRNAAEGMEWLRLAAAGGIPEAAVELARAYEQGRGVAKAPDEAARWWFRAGKLGDTAARDRFVSLFLDGTTQDDLGGPEVAEWLSDRAAAGDAAAVLGLAGMYELGRGVPVDPAEAERWYLRLALKGNAEAQYRLGRMMLSRPAVWRAPKTEFRDGEWTGPSWSATKPEDDSAYLARPGMLPAQYWLTAAARQGHARAQYLLGMAYLGGMDLPFDLVEAVSWISAAAEQRDPDALMAEADLAAKGQGFHGKDPVRAWVDLDLAAQAGRKDAAAAREMLAATLSARQLARARQLAQDIRDVTGE